MSLRFLFLCKGFMMGKSISLVLMLSVALTLMINATLAQGVAEQVIPYEFVEPPQIPAGYFSDEVASSTSIQTFSDSIEKVAVLVDSELYPEFNTQINNYEADVEANFPVDIILYSNNYRNMTFEQVRAELQAIWLSEGISGAVLVGFFPSMEFNVPGQGVTPMAQAMGYEDLDGTFTDEGYYVIEDSSMVYYEGEPDGIYDHHYWNNNGMEIWAAFIRPYQPSATSTEYTAEVRLQLQDYFTRLHKYYTGQTVIPRRGLVCTNRDWRWDGDNLEATLEQTYGDGNCTAFYGGRNCGFRYLQARASGYEIAYLYSHSASWFHQFDRGPMGDVSNTLLIPENGRGAVITYGFNCHGADYLETPTGCMGQRYVFGSELGQTYVGCTISTGVIGIIEQSIMLKNGEYLGSAFFKALNAAYQSNQGFDPAGDKTIWGQIILGNPFVTATAGKNFSATPASISGAVEGYLRLTAIKDDNIAAIVYSDAESYSIGQLAAGTYNIMAEQVQGDLIGYFTATVAEGENLTGIDIAMPNYGTSIDSWYYFHQTSGRELPSDWNSATADMTAWDGQGKAPIGFDEEAVFEDGTGINSFGDDSGTVYVRNSFTVESLGANQSVYVYGLTANGQAPNVWVNGTAMTMESITDRTSLSYWKHKLNITSAITTGTNYIVVSGYQHLDVSAPIYSTDELVDFDPPMPSPMSFEEPITVSSSTAVTMEATIAYDAHFDVKYYFECVAGDGHDSGWRTNRVYTDVNLQPNTYYAYRVKACDTSPNSNETEYSEPMAVTTYGVAAGKSDAYHAADVADYGWNSEWTTVRENGYLRTPPFGLSYPGICTEGRCTKIATEFDTPGQVSNRMLKTSYTNGTVWMSALIRADNVGVGHFFIVPGTSFESAVGKQWGAYFSINNDNSSILMEAGKTYLLVARYDLSSGTDTTYIWVNPTLDSEPQIANAASKKDDKDIGSITKLEINASGYGSGIYYVDEVRFARTWDGVIGESEYYCPAVPEGDLNGDCEVGLDDLMMLCQRWLTPSVFGEADLSDFVDINSNWLTTAKE